MTIAGHAYDVKQMGGTRAVCVDQLLIQPLQSETKLENYDTQNCRCSFRNRLRSPNWEEVTQVPTKCGPWP